jgi:hypothetical protein
MFVLTCKARAEGSARQIAAELIASNALLYCLPHIAAAKDVYWAEIVEIHRQVASAWVSVTAARPA